MKFIQCFIIIFVFLLTPLVWGGGDVDIEYITDCSIIGKTKCNHCKTPILISCEKNGSTFIGYVGSNTRYLYRPYANDRSLLRMDLRYEYSKRTVGDVSIGWYFGLIDDVPLYNSPLGERMISYAGKKSKNSQDGNFQCRYISLPTKKKIPRRGISLSVCYGNVACVVGKGQTRHVQTGCIAQPQGDCPKAGDCVADDTIADEDIFKFEIEEMSKELQKKFQEEHQASLLTMDEKHQASLLAMDEKYQNKLELLQTEYEYMKKEREAVQDWIKREKETRDRYEAIKAHQDENTRKRQRARHGGR